MFPLLRFFLVHFCQSPVGVWSEAWTVLAGLKTGVMGLNPTWCMYVYVYLFYVCAVLCVGWGLAVGWYLIEGVLLTVYKIMKLKSGQGPTIVKWKFNFSGTFPPFKIFHTLLFISNQKTIWSQWSKCMILWKSIQQIFKVKPMWNYLYWFYLITVTCFTPHLVPSSGSIIKWHTLGTNNKRSKCILKLSHSTEVCVLEIFIYSCQLWKTG